ncbi:signal peptidase I [Methylobacterium tarhaniae]|uniref:signal peptidase I n=1 Tax=Methylobacterium tarhaniae TaxID=1187852 RepID=UPI00069E9C7D|nr:signal peptidase I [Methylobacterium tarhaniae]
MTDQTSPRPSRLRRWGGMALAGLLSLVCPGLGHIRARAWPLGVALMGAWVAATAVMLGVTALWPPTPPVVTAWLALVAALIVVWIGAAIDAMRRARSSFRRPPSPWWRSTWLAALLVVPLQFGLDSVMPFGWRSFSIPSASMNPGLVVGDVFLADARRDRPFPARGDIVMFKARDLPDTIYVKRVVGLPGDTVAVTGGALVLNGRPVPVEPDGTVTVGNGQTAQAFIERPPGRDGYRIARLDGTFSRSDLPTTTIPPDAVFVLGDNRDSSLDSRHAEIGPVRAEDLVATGGTFTWSPVKGRMLTALR